MWFYFSLFFSGIIFFFESLGFADDSSIHNTQNEPNLKESIRIGYMTFVPYKQADRELALNLLVKNLSSKKLDVLLLSGIKNEKELDSLKNILSECSSSFLLKIPDEESYLAFISKDVPISHNAITDRSYKIKNSEIRVKRGFLVISFKINHYSLTLLLAHLIDRIKHPQFTVSDMRRYEARQLRQLVDSLYKNDKNINLLLMANCNDTPDSSSLKALYSRRYNWDKRLYDIRPIDSLGTSWTYYSPWRDEYQRDTFALATSGLLPEIDLSKTEIVENNELEKYFINRPIIVTINPSERVNLSKEHVEKTYPNVIRK